MTINKQLSLFRYKILIGDGLGKSYGKVIRYHSDIAVAVIKINIEPPDDQQSENLSENCVI